MGISLQFPQSDTTPRILTLPDDVWGKAEPPRPPPPSLGWIPPIGSEFDPDANGLDISRLIANQNSFNETFFENSNFLKFKVKM